MSTKEKIEIIKSEIIKVIGPIGKFMVEKQVDVLGHTEDDLPEELLPILIDKVVDIGVYDIQMSKSLKHSLREKIGLE